MTDLGRFLPLAVAASLMLPFVCGSFQGIPGNYCRNRKPSECCDDRWDDCSVPIRGTFCYCDQFCNSKSDSQHDDCCPDYREVCLKNPDPCPSNKMGRQRRSHSGCDKNMDNCNRCELRNGKLECEADVCLVDEKLLEEVNSNPQRYHWTAANHSQFWGRKLMEGLQLRTGTLPPTQHTMGLNPVRLYPHSDMIPRHFDARHHPQWRGRVSGAIDQGWCGASWAASSISVAQDRLSILAHGTEGLRLSLQNLLSCSNHDGGCGGGRVQQAWHYLRLVGVVPEDCYHYESGSSSVVPQCKLPLGAVTHLQCQHPYRFKMEPAYRISSREEDIMWELLTNGPVQALMTVEPSLFLYSSGVYQCEGSKPNSLHSVRLVGWGEMRDVDPSQPPIKYWVAANSWGRDWGEDGFFRIRRGNNECGVESFVLAVRGRLANHVYGKVAPHKSQPLPQFLS